MNTQTKQQGFTLLEMLVAIGVFVILSAISYSTLNSVLADHKKIENLTARLAAIQKTITVLQRDFTQIINRPIRDEFGDPQDPLSINSAGSTMLSLTRSGWHNPAGQARSNLQRVAYRLDDGNLYRIFWMSLDQAPSPTALETQLLSEVNNIEFNFMDGEKQWHNSWPPLSAENEDKGQLPVAVRIKLELEDIGDIERLFAMAR